MKMKTILLVLLTVALMSCFGKGEVRYQKIKRSSKTIAMGFIENRDRSFQQGFSGNLRDMLSFELAGKGYATFDPDYSGFYKKTHTSKAKKDDLMPARFNNIAGEMRYSNVIINPQSRHLLPAEIRKLSQKNKFDIFIQGTISTMGGDIIMDEEVSTLVFLRLYDSRSNKVGLVNYRVSGKSLDDVDLLQEITSRIADHISRVGRSR